MRPLFWPLTARNRAAIASAMPLASRYFERPVTSRHGDLSSIGLWQRRLGHGVQSAADTTDVFPRFYATLWGRQGLMIGYSLRLRSTNGQGRRRRSACGTPRTPVTK